METVKKTKEQLQKELEELEIQEEEKRLEEEARLKKQNEESNKNQVPEPQLMEEKDLILNIKQICRKIKDFEEQIKFKSVIPELTRYDLVNKAELFQEELFAFANDLQLRFKYKPEQITELMKKATDVKTFFGYNFLFDGKK